MPTTSTHLANLHFSCALLTGGMFRGTLQAATGLPDDVFTDVLAEAIRAGQILCENGRYRAVALIPA